MGALARETIVSLSLCESSTVQGHFLAVARTKHTEFASVMAFRAVYDCEILISEIERRPAVYDCLLKEYSDTGLKERLLEEVRETVVCFCVEPTGRPRKT
jgi:hypothetical protein